MQGHADTVFPQLGFRKRFIIEPHYDSLILEGSSTYLGCVFVPVHTPQSHGLDLSEFKVHFDRPPLLEMVESESIIKRFHSHLDAKQTCMYYTEGVTNK